MRRFGSQKGEGKIGCLFWVLVLGAVALVASRVIPVKISTMKLEDHMEELVMANPRQPKSFFEREIANRARDLNLPLAKEKIQVRKSEDRIIIDVRFTVPMDFVVTQHDWDITIYKDLDIFLF